MVILNVKKHRDKSLIHETSQIHRTVLYIILFVFICIVNYLPGIVEYTLDRKDHLIFAPLFVLSIDSSLKVVRRHLNILSSVGHNISLSKKYVSRFQHSYRLRYMNHTSFIFNISHVCINGFFFFFSVLTSWPHFWSAFGIGAELHSLFECRTENNIFVRF